MAAAGKGFGAPAKKQAKPPAELCPCGSTKSYKVCTCTHTAAPVASSSNHARTAIARRISRRTPITTQECCKRLHSGQAAAPSVEDTVRARFSAILKRDVSYLVKSTAPAFHSFHYGGEPGASTAQLTEDMQNTVDNYEYSGLKIREVRVCVFMGEEGEEGTPTLID